MHLHIKIALVTLAATIILAVGSVGAFARNLSTNETGSSVRFTFTFGSSVGDVECPVTLRGSFHSRTITKTDGLLIGAVTGATVNDSSCTNGRATVLSGTLPWHIRYRSFVGTLPSIQRIITHVVGLAFRVQFGVSVACLCQFTSAKPFLLIMEVGPGNEVRIMEADPDAMTDLEDEDFICAIGGDASIGGNGPVDGNVVEPITMRLIA
jgi:hypothetical protein